MTLILSIITGLLSGVVSGLFVFWLLSRYEPRVEIVCATLTDHLRITVRNAGRGNCLLKYPVASAVEIVAELHIVSSIISSDPAYSRRLSLRRSVPLIIKPQATFVFVTTKSTDELREYFNKVKEEWVKANRNVENIGVRFRLFSRDGFSNTANVATENWEMASFFSSSGIISGLEIRC